MISIASNVTFNSIIKKSKFLSFAYFVRTEDEVDKIVNQLNSEYHDATHVCYAYVLHSPNKEKACDNGEPDGTAGKPILDCIKKKGLSNILVAVVRYFGGIKLGAGGLVRAYSGSASDVINCADIVEYATAYKYESHVPIANAKIYQQGLERQGAKIVSVSYGVDVVLKFYSFNEIQDDYATLISCDLEVKK